ncbi:MAG: hypothetical protein A2X00_06230 [Bacteroidetes bacterium GWE2_32_14]|nr:MAG: hypothetical protein A2X00_06230 [Bacteroidetes bacterium GWE2_32_14]
MLCDFKLKFKVDEFTVFKNDSWTWSIRPAQPTLGSGILSLNRYALHLSDVSLDEMKDLGKIIQIIERTMKQVFDYEIMNYLMLMMVDHHVHYHVIPRYSKKKIFANLEWEDNGWPAIPALGKNQHMDKPEIHKNLLQILKENLVL